MAASGINHVSILTRDLDESERFYADMVGAERIDSPNFGSPVRWLRVGDVQIHLLQDDRGGSGPGHFAITVDDLAPVHEHGRRRDAFDPAANGHHLWELPDGVVQLYLRDPSGNLVEVNALDASSLPEAARAELRALADAQPQSEANLRARLLM